MLTILTVTRYADYAIPFLTAHDDLADAIGCTFIEHDGSGARCIEDILDEAVAGCPDEWILRLDDDELPSQEMVDWLAADAYEAADHWAFPRLNLWGDEDHYITTPPLYPDLQTRLSVKTKSGGRHQIHAGSPHGTGEIAPCAIEHHKFLVRPLAERQALAREYELIAPGAGVGSHYSAFSTPEFLPNLNVCQREGRPTPLHTGKE